MQCATINFMFRMPLPVHNSFVLVWFGALCMWKVTIDEHVKDFFLQQFKSTHHSDVHRQRIRECCQASPQQIGNTVFVQHFLHVTHWDTFFRISNNVAQTRRS
mmetsp:Transcript_60369/g.178770  ORF Transcript_60369/g.178770 Transcript_60369/m.178770 type:complete len:103 (-) Transcript_60369:164-472(-)